MALIKFSNGSKIKFLDKVLIQPYGYGTSNAGSLATDLQAFYKLSNTSDSSGNGNTLTNNGSVSFSSGKIGNAATFTGNSSQYLRTESLSFTSNTAISLTAWVKRTSTAGGARPILSTGALGSNSNGIGLYADQNQGLQWTPFANLDLRLNGSEFTNDVWFHTVLVGTRSGSTTSWTMYVNGSSHTTGTGSGWFGTSNKNGLLIGRANEAQYGVGQIDAVGIWSRALTTGEISDLYNSGAGREI